MPSSSIKLTTSLAVLALMQGAEPVGAQEEHRLPPSAMQVIDPVACSENREIVIRDRSIWTDGDGVVASGNCSLQIIDSHLLAGGVGIRADGNAEVIVSGSFVQGRRGAVRADGNAEVIYRDSTLRGGVDAAGNAELIDDGGNRFERIPASAARALTTGEALSCDARDRITVVHRYVESDGDGITLRGDCELLLSDSHVHAAGAAIRVLGAGSIRVRNSTLHGSGHAVWIDGGGTVNAAGTNLEGPVEIASGRFVDGGGNAGGARAPSTQAPAAAGAGSRARVRIGPGGVEVSGGRAGEGGRVGAGGIEIEAEGDGVPREPIETCAELCEIWPGLTSGKQDCVATVLSVLGYPIEETADCVAVETEAQCRVCARAIAARDAHCRTAFDRCIAR